ncbi:MAG: TIGR00282 family metallophosphoesterase [Candidatus Margulisiibacteriota bacterium]
MKNLTILFIGDIIGRYGRAITNHVLPLLKAEMHLDLVIANGENSASGNGITEKVYAELVAEGIEVITMGNHIWDKKEFIPKIDECPRLIRPANYPDGVPGPDHLIIEKSGVKIGVFNLCGRVFMPALDCPFKRADRLVEEIKRQTNLIIVDMHAEATSEKQALATHLDGMVSAVIGSHTHVQTADEKIMSGGTAYITDVGMVGADDSIIGMQKGQILQRYLTQMPSRYEVETSGPALFNAVILNLDAASGKATTIKRIFRRLETIDPSAQ